jgi:hypothetical protein
MKTPYDLKMVLAPPEKPLPGLLPPVAAPLVSRQIFLICGPHQRLAAYSKFFQPPKPDLFFPTYPVVMPSVLRGVVPGSTLI